MSRNHPPSVRLQAWLSAVGPTTSAEPTSSAADVIRPASAESAVTSEIETRHSVSQIRRPLPSIGAQSVGLCTATEEEDCQPSSLTLPALSGSIGRSPSPTSVLKSRSPKRKSQINEGSGGAGEGDDQQLGGSDPVPLFNEDEEADKASLRLNTPPMRLHPSKIMERPDDTGLTAPAAPDYNGRSARGGRGGQVTSVAQLWHKISGQKGADPGSLPPDM